MKKKLLMCGLAVLVVVVAVVAVFVFGKDKSELTKYADKTVAKESQGYKLDLRIWGTYDKKKINTIVVASNYKNQDKTITVGNSSTKSLLNRNDEDNENTYVIKGSKKYKLVEGQLKDVDKVPYENTDIYLEGINSMKNVKKSGTETISDSTYTVYKGTVSKNVINKVASYTDLSMKFEKDCEVEVWLTKDNYVYKVYYRVEDMTIYASYFGFGKTGKVDLEQYKKEAV